MKTKLFLCSLMFAGIQTMDVLAAQNCQAGFTFSVNNNAVTFTNTSTGGTNNVSYGWQFGDGDYSGLNNPSHTYQYNGTYYVYLTMGDSLQTCYSVYSDTVVITGGINPPCNALFYADADSTSKVYFYDASTGRPTSWTWKFGDNTASSLQYPSHQYAQSGVYNVCLTITTATSGTCTYCNTIRVKGVVNPLCIAGFGFKANKTAARFTNTSTGGTANTTYTWNFGDGEYSSLKNPRHSYKYNGTYNVCLSMYDSLQSCYSQYCDTIVIKGGINPPICTAGFGVKINKTTVKFTNTSTGGSGKTTYTWSFGDGEYSTLKNSNHKYKYNGIYNVCLTMVDSFQICYSRYCDTVVIKGGINPPVCTAGFRAQINKTAAKFTNTSTGGTGKTTYIWSFGDGEYSTLKNPRHAYKYNGTYNVCLNMGDSLQACYDHYCGTVVITAGCNLLSVVGNETNPSSPSACDGAISVTSVAGGVAPYKYTWLPNVSSSSSASELCAGRYDVTVTDANGCTGMQSYYVMPDTMRKVPCVADFTYLVVGNSVAFTNTSTGGNFLSLFRWDFGDNTGELGDWTHKVYHGWMKKGFYPVSLIMYDSLGTCADTNIQVVEITQDSSSTGGCSASVSLFQDSTNSNPLLWYAYANVNGTASFTYLWNFGDGSTSTQQYPSHTYATAGHYAICLTITDVTGCTSSSCDMAYKRTQGGMIKNLIVVPHTTDIHENVLSVTSIFPNPASDVLEVSLNQVVQGEVRIIDITGREVYKEKINADNVKVSVSNLPAGFYDLSIVAGDKKSHSKIMIMR